MANDSISLDIFPGEILALLGENGAGKSTLMSILFGHYVADSGSIQIFGHTLPPGNPRLALQAGISMVHQHFSLADNLNVLDNVMLGTESLWKISSNRSTAQRHLMEVAQRFRLEINAHARVAELSVGERQRVEILKALYRGTRILILDEPTAVLTPQESESLFDTLNEMVTQGLSVIFISHKLAEVMQVSHRIAILRAGKLVATAATADVTQIQLAQWMVGKTVHFPTRHPSRTRTEVVCELQGVSTASTTTRNRLHDIYLQLHAGEIVAVAGVSGNGQTALAGVLFGTLSPAQGELLYRGEPMPASPAARVAQGIARVPEDRHTTGIIGDMPLWENAVAERLRESMFSRWGWIRRRAAQRHAQHIIDAFDVRGGGLFAPARSLSGGNMQKLILGRALLPANAPPEDGVQTSQPHEPNLVNSPRLIVAHQPTWGLDIGAVSYVHQQLFAARDAGAAVLVISDDLDEVMLLGDRIAVMHDGHLSDAFPAEQWSRASLGMAMAGGEPSWSTTPTAATSPEAPTREVR